MNRAFFLSKIPLEDMAAIYQNAEMLIYPSVFEGFGIPILEAYILKIPVITSKGSCFHESGGPESIYINPLCHKEIKQAIVQIQKHPNKRNQVITEGFKHAKKFNDNNIAKNIISVYEKFKLNKLEKEIHNCIEILKNGELLFFIQLIQYGEWL